MATIFSPIKADFPLMNGREYNVNEEIRESKWGSAGDGRDQETGLPTSWDDLCETSCESVAVFSCCQPCSGHSSLRGNCFAPGTGLVMSSAPHFSHFTVAESFPTG